MIAKLWGLIPAQYRITALLVILAVLAGICLSIWGYGEIKYAAGKTAGAATCRADHAVAAANESNKATKQRDANEDETRRMSDPDLDRLLHDNGWLRRPDDR